MAKPADATRAKLERAVEDDPYDDASRAVLADYLEERGELGGLPAEVGTTLEVRHGLAFGARIVQDDFHPPSGAVAARVDALLAHPCGSFVVELGVAHVARTLEADLGEVVDAIARRRPRALRKLVLGDHANWHGFVHTGRIAALWRATDRVAQLVLNGEFEVGEVSAVAATRVELRARSFDDDPLAALAEARWPRVVELHVEVSLGDADNVVPLLARDDLDALVELSLRGGNLRDGVVDAVLGSPMLPRLRRLALAGCGLRDTQAKQLARAKPRLAHLDELDVSENMLGRAGIAALRNVAKRVVATQQIPPPPGRRPRERR
jgi:uncharacterized protein (TIGR02996 family)